jgi:phage tail-like protein
VARAVSANAVNPRHVRVAFDAAIRTTAGSTTVFAAKTAPAVPLTARELQADGALLDIELDTEMTPGAAYEVTVLGVTDSRGVPITAAQNTSAFTGFRPAGPPGRRFSLWEMLPKHNRRDDTTGDLWRFIACLQEVTDLLLSDCDRFPDLFDLERAPEPFLDAILTDLGNPFPFELDVLGKRRLASVLVELYQQKGTAVGLRNAARFFLELEIQVLPYSAETMTLGESLLGEDWVLGPSNRFARYAFNVAVTRRLSGTERKQLRQLVEYLKPAHTHCVSLLEPELPTPSPDWVLGASDLGVASRLN